MRRVLFAAVFILFPLWVSAQESVERIDVEGNTRVTRETILYYISMKEGDPFNPNLLRRDFRVLWSTGFFSDIRIEEEDGEKGKIVRIVVEENPVIRTVSYKTGRKVKEDDIVNKLKEKDEYLLPYSYFSQHRVQRIRQTIQDLLQEKGLPAATVDIETARRGNNEVEINFKIDEGPRMRVGEVVFEGRTKIPGSYLREAMKENKVHSFYSWIAAKDVFKEGRVESDLALIRKRLQEHGYMEAIVGEPRFEEIERRTVLFRRQKMMRIIIPVEAGYLYRVGEVKVDGNKALLTGYLRSLAKFDTGDIYSTKVRETAIEKMGEIYRDFGYLYANIIPVESLDPRKKIVNITFNVYEGEVAYLNRLEFRGNQYTKDKVIRREMLIREGDRFSLAMFKDSILRIKQLGLVDLERDPDIQPNPEDPTQIDVTVNVKELQRNNIQFTAGYSGYEGTFVALSYSTVNFLGAGETLDLTLQHGKRIRNYSFGFTEPYLFDNPITAGFNIFSRKMFLPGLYNQDSKGVDVTVGARIFGYWRTNLTYSYQDINITLPGSQGSMFDSGESGAPMFDPVYQQMFGLGKYKVSSLMPMIFRSTIDSPLTPSRGTMYSASLKFSGSFLGGEISLIKPRLEFTRFQPFISNHVIGVHAEYQFVRSIRGSEIPFWEKFYLGGERSVRGYEIYTIGPRSERGTVIGGEKSLVLNAEYIIPAGGPLYAIFFHDRGVALSNDRTFNLRNMYTSTGLEARIFVPALRVPFRLIFSYNSPKILRDESNFAFRFAVGTTF
ncbi:MAG: outer membrane protein assembly factor BamA [Acidobacteriota bacterium]|nr:outer membrane protein assembly factor BamA [Acidobacteriota bacterium]